MFTGPERDFLKALVIAKITPSHIQLKVVCGDQSHSINFAYADIKLGLEVDGENYTVDWRYPNRDRDRDLALETAGWKILRFREKEDIEEGLPKSIEVVKVALKDRKSSKLSV